MKTSKNLKLKYYIYLNNKQHKTASSIEVKNITLCLIFEILLKLKLSCTAHLIEFRINERVIVRITFKFTLRRTLILLN